jgi:hypothetical protein
MKILLFILIFITSNCFAQEKLFLSCSGTITVENKDHQSSKPNNDSVSSFEALTEVVIDKTNKSMQIQMPLLNICAETEKCDCSFTNDSYSCKSSIENGKLGTNFYDSIYKKFSIGRKSGIGVFTYLSQNLMTLPLASSLVSSSYSGQLQCKTLEKNKF